MKLPTKIVLGIVAVSLVIALTQIDFSAEGKETETTAPEPETVVDVASDANNLSTFIVALKSAGLVDTLRNGGPYTIFAPADTAFSSLPEGEYGTLMQPENKDRLAQLVQNHAVNGVIEAEDLENGDTLQTLTGASLVINRSNDSLRVNGSLITNSDIPASNGVVHIVETLIDTTHAQADSTSENSDAN